jgi:ketosteroid isomerase-like protein
MQGMDDLTLIKIRFALQDLNTAFTRNLDHGNIEELVDLFTADALYTHAKRRSQGRDEIRKLFVARAEAGVRTVRHLASGLKLDIDSESAARGSSVCITFAHDGPAPAPHATAHLVADFEDVYRLCDDGKWRIAVRHIHRIFVAGDNTGPVGGGGFMGGVFGARKRHGETG